MKFHSLLLCLILLSACISPSPNIRDIPAEPAPYTLISQATETYIDTQLRWGGTVIDVENEIDSSLMQVLFYPLDANGYPQTNEPSQGRFAIKTSKFLDPAIFVKDAEITVAGSVKGEIERLVGHKPVRMPLIEAEAVCLWPKEYRGRRYYDEAIFRYVPDPYFGGYCGPYGYWW
ncbi:MAG TPA: Slp family lipoprotein [Nitrosomonas halophila]|nr:Slp family lipoprotein [Nitrosomonas halophila]